MYAECEIIVPIICCCLHAQNFVFIYFCFVLNATRVIHVQVLQCVTGCNTALDVYKRDIDGKQYAHPTVTCIIACVRVRACVCACLYVRQYDGSNDGNNALTSF